MLASLGRCSCFRLAVLFTNSSYKQPRLEYLCNCCCSGPLHAADNCLSPAAWVYSSLMPHSIIDLFICKGECFSPQASRGSETRFIVILMTSGRQRPNFPNATFAGLLNSALKMYETADSIDIFRKRPRIFLYLCVYRLSNYMQLSFTEQR